MNILCLSDLHGHTPLLNTAGVDLVIIAGDIVPLDAHDPIRSAVWLDTVFRQWLSGIPCPVIGIAGNHDFIFENAPYLIPQGLPWTYLQDSGTMFNGLTVWGSPHQPVFYDWAFNKTEESLARYWGLIPNNVDILITHGPPKGIGDMTDRGEAVGSYTLMDRIKQLPQLKLHVFGHIHSGAGVYSVGNTTFVNGSYVNEEYFPYNDPIVVEIT